MTDEQLDVAYTDVCRALTAAGAARGDLYLARLALALMHELDDPVRIATALAAARLPDTSSP
jgi:hypothetical protein